MEYLFVIPECEFEEDPNGVDYDIMEDKSVYKLKSDQYVELLKELERVKKL